MPKRIKNKQSNNTESNSTNDSDLSKQAEDLTDYRTNNQSPYSEKNKAGLSGQIKEMLDNGEIDFDKVSPEVKNLLTKGYQGNQNNASIASDMASAICLAKGAHNFLTLSGKTTE